MTHNLSCMKVWLQRTSHLPGVDPLLSPISHTISHKVGHYATSESADMFDEVRPRARGVKGVVKRHLWFYPYPIWSHTREDSSQKVKELKGSPKMPSPLLLQSKWCVVCPEVTPPLPLPCLAWYQQNKPSLCQVSSNFCFQRGQKKLRRVRLVGCYFE